MKPNKNFLGKPKYFWACVRSLSQQIGYSANGCIKEPSIEDMALAFGSLGLDPCRIISEGEPTELAIDLEAYFKVRARTLAVKAKGNLLNEHEAKKLFKQTLALGIENKFAHKCPQPMNKQKKEKRAEAFLTCIVNMTIEKQLKGLPCNFDPQQLTTITKDGAPLRTLARRVDGSFPSSVNPIAIWEIKEYYYSKTFGSRIADGVYETLLDGMEIEELRDESGIDVKHYFMVDAYETWWDQGKPYLCRMFDMLHMGYVDEILFGKEVVEELPRIVKEWIDIHRDRAAHDAPADPKATLL